MNKKIALPVLIIGSYLLGYCIFYLVTFFLPLSSSEGNLLSLVFAGFFSCIVIMSALKSQSPVSAHFLTAVMSVATIISVGWLVVSAPVIFFLVIMGSGGIRLSSASNIDLAVPFLMGLGIWLVPPLLLYGTCLAWIAARKL